MLSDRIIKLDEALQLTVNKMAAAIVMPYKKLMEELASQNKKMDEETNIYRQLLCKKNVSLSAIDWARELQDENSKLKSQIKELEQDLDFRNKRCEAGDKANLELVRQSKDLQGEVDRLNIVMHTAQGVLTCLNIGDIKSESAMHIKLREVMIAYREAASELAQ